MLSRSRQDATEGDSVMHIKGDLSLVETVPAAFDKVRSAWDHPTAVLYNGAVRTVLGPEDPLADFSLPSFQSDTTVNLTSAILAAKHAVEGFHHLPSTLNPHKTFIYTGNKLYKTPLPGVLQFGVGKSAAAHLIWHLSLAYGKKMGGGDGSLGRFYLTDERSENGDAVYRERSGSNMAGVVARLVFEGGEGGGQGFWYHTFVGADPRYRDFTEQDSEAARTWEFDMPVRS